MNWPREGTVAIIWFGRVSLHLGIVKSFQSVRVDSTEIIHNKKGKHHIAVNQF